MAISRRISSKTMIKQPTNQDSLGGSGGGGGAQWVISSQTVTNGGQITITATDYYQLVLVDGNAAAVTASITPFTATPADGATIRLLGTNDTNTVTINNSDVNSGAVINGSVTLGRYQSIDFQWNTTMSRFVEVCRNA